MTHPEASTQVNGARNDSRYDRSRWWTVPNILTLARIAGSFALVWLAHAGLPGWFIGLFAALLLTDWLDGKLASLLHQRTLLGARLDSAGDSILYGCLIVGVALLEEAFVRANAILLGVMLISYALTVAIALARFGKLPALHTRAAKTCWFLISVGAITLLAGGPWWPAQVAIVAVILTNAEALLICLMLRRWRTDVPSVWHAARFRSAADSP